ncbi:MAG: SpoIIE family protein phosphatase [Bacteroidia bacterium]
MEKLNPEQLLLEKERLESLRLELEEKNKQMWAMSEMVYKEKKKTEEQLNEILNEKSKLEEQKRENEEKVKMLWEQSTAIHFEKERIDKLKTQVEYRHKEIIDSVLYAKKIQQAILPSQDYVNSILSDSFILFKPRNIVSGDFFWVYKIDEHRVLFAAVDCTGHGVPGAFMSIMGYHLLERVVSEQKIYEPAQILDELSKGVVKSLRQTTELDSVKDGMDIALCKIDYENYTLQYAGAHNPLYLIRNGILNETKADRRSVGISVGTKVSQFTNHTIQLEKGDCIYLFSDGYVDQKGGPENVKFFYQPFKELLLKICPETMAEQYLALDKVITEWKGERGQMDDMLVMGVRVH